ncbi:unnamed protein product [Ceutorhynchus assimilis]|uniref:Uncharacterized protein n=1 Tax=Ceutorhynchus assimilis TaxID=467358 RepID=A0A9N9MYC5_9CUCU|nr:unnamed protein product [Ceutorhynchus assimilis]
MLDLSEDSDEDNRPIIFIGHDNLYVVWCGWNFTRAEWLWFKYNQLLHMPNDDNSCDQYLN